MYKKQVLIHVKTHNYLKYKHINKCTILYFAR